ncbi:MAG: alpha-amylase family glycosyl hydrolase, partial [Chloroflexota bacterium]
RLRLRPDAPVQRVYLRTFPDGEQLITPMQQTAVSPPAQWWEADLAINQPTVHYRFILQAADGVWFYTAAGPTAHVPLDRTDFRLLADYVGPAWVKTAVFYQIFPDRFHNGDPHLNPQPDDFEFHGMRPQTLPWGAPPPADSFNPFTFYGGDLPGIAARLDYLADLGINAIYLNPIFTAYTNHKYDVADYFHVDPHFGGDEALAALRQALTARNMRYLLDIVPNHCGYGHPWFQAARQDIGAAEAEFFTFYEHPDKYAQWLMAWVLPKLNYTSAELRRLMYVGEDAAFRQWLRPPFAADGWRVDVANMLGRQGALQMNRVLAEGIYQAVKETRADAYLIGENFFDATESMQEGGQWDGIMNYAGFSLPLLHWLRGLHMGAIGLEGEIVSPVPWSTAALATTWQQHLAAIPWVAALQQFNLLGSHDTSRVRTLLGENEALQRLAVTVLMTFPGVPSIYYGDEIGLTDTPGLSQRACMPWDEADWNHDLLAFYKDVIKLRRETAVLQNGGFQLLLLEADTFAYQREDATSYAIVIAHRGERPRPAAPLPVANGGIADGVRFVEFFTGQEAVVVNGALPLPPVAQGVMLWLTAH